MTKGTEDRNIMTLRERVKLIGDLTSPQPASNHVQTIRVAKVVTRCLSKYLGYITSGINKISTYSPQFRPTSVNLSKSTNSIAFISTYDLSWFCDHQRKGRSIPFACGVCGQTLVVFLWPFRSIRFDETCLDISSEVLSMQ